MTHSRVQVLTQVTARSGREAELRELLLQVVAQRCQKQGCIRSDLLSHHVRATDFILIEEWELEVRLRSTFNTVSLERLFEQGVALIAKPPRVDWYELIETQTGTSESASLHLDSAVEE
ncbi:hypothetical protein IFO70_32695 [Phormidium tenue FACHB-886]|nr:hypothetical protein [Phormidium tenue FACHB-886]